MLGEDVENHGGTVDHLGGVFEGSTLAWRQIVIHHDGVGILLRHDTRQFACLTGTDIGGRVRLDTMLKQPVAHHGARSLGECGQLSQ